MTALLRGREGAILVVDDTPANLRLVTEMLVREGFAVRVAPDGHLALQSVAASLPDLILLDIRMPDIDGLEVCRRLKADERTRGVPVIFLSALQETGDKLRGFAVGGVDYITKPFVAEEVLARVRAHLKLRALELHLEERVNERTRALRCLSAGNNALVRAATTAGLINDMCRAIVDVGGYAGAWVGLTDGAEASAGAPDVGAPDIGALARQAAAGPTAGPEHTALLVLPMTDAAAHELGRLAILADAPAAFDNEGEVALLTELAGDLAFGLQTLREREERLRSREALERALERTIQAVAATIEVRDPYTAGHQRRVADIAVAIGRELGVDDDQLKGLFMAGVVHDIGKISVPAEILVRPGRLSESEFNLIKCHSETGYRILKDIEFPWPVATAVLQHHERLDGSGYPHGVSGDAILFEARVLTVADVVEAIASHRPYRPALGLDRALEELARGRGRVYDAAVVDACQRLAKNGRLDKLLAEEKYPR